MPGTHDERIRDAFTRQATTFEDERLNVAFTSGLPWLLAHTDPRPGDVVLDVAAGTGMVSRALAPGVARAVALDSTQAMIAEGRQRIRDEGRSNVIFVAGSAERLPFADGSFTLVVTRFSLHHFADPAPALAEIARVCAPGGRVVVKDLVASTDPEIASRQDHIERLRDSSHLRMPARGAVPRWLRDLGLQVDVVAERDIDRPLEPWLEQSLTHAEPAARVRQAFDAELAGGEATGMWPHRRDGALWFHQRWELTVAHRLSTAAATGRDR
ncbi:MAG: methyltransferase domain-containing protein [Actinomycetota bacterium]|nr:methyltransferase domain-containing protein [Actinomycetota bacterium]